jgi:hypothetical protein
MKKFTKPEDLLIIISKPCSEEIERIQKIYRFHLYLLKIGV